jgi:NAD(P)-dependent dehydrogenase (short-subunit alcohol dehydrogenase family)
VLVTGASTGIGRACALHLDGLGFQVLAGVRSEKDARDLKESGSGQLAPLFLDVTQGESLKAGLAATRDKLVKDTPFSVVNNAGIAVGGPLEYIPLESLQHQLSVNVTGQLAVTQTFLPLVRERKGRIVFMGSISGLISSPLLGPYSASKFAMEAIVDALRVELRPWGIPVSLVEPGSVDTPIWEKSIRNAEALLETMPDEAETLYGPFFERRRKQARRRGRSGISTERVAEVVAHALTSRRPKTRYLVGLDARALSIFGKYVPDRIRDGIIARLMGIPGPP